MVVTGGSHLRRFLMWYADGSIDDALAPFVCGVMDGALSTTVYRHTDCAVTITGLDSPLQNALTPP